MKIRILTTGGTFDKVYFDAKSEFQVGATLVEELLQEANTDIEYEISSLLRKDSLDLGDEDRALIRGAVERDPAERIIVIHGTDTMVETGVWLQGIEGKTIVLTGSMQPARLRKSDAMFNLGCAVSAVQLLNVGVYIVMNGRVFDPASTRKNVKAHRFELKNL